MNEWLAGLTVTGLLIAYAGFTAWLARVSKEGRPFLKWLDGIRAWIANEEKPK